MIRAVYTLRSDDGDFGRAAMMLGEVFDDEQRERFVDKVVGHLLHGVSEPTLQRAFEYWRNVDKSTGGMKAKA